MGPRARSPHPMGAGVRAAEARLHGGLRQDTAAGALHADPPVRDDAAGRERLVEVLARSVHEGPAPRREGGHRLFEPAQRLLDGARGADVHGGPGAAHRMRQRRQPSHRPRLHAAARDRRAALARRLARTARPAIARREPRALVRRRRGRRAGGDWPDAGAARAHPRRDDAADAAGDARSPHHGLHLRPDADHRHRLWPRAGAAREPSRSVDDAQGHDGLDCRKRRVVVPAKEPRRRAGRAELPAAVRRRPVRPQPAELEGRRHRRRARQPRDLPALAGVQRLQRGARRAVQPAARRPPPRVRRREVGRVYGRVDPERRRVGQLHVGRRPQVRRRRGHAGVHERRLAGLLPGDEDSPARRTRLHARGREAARRRPPVARRAS